jgi:hypothetical protein
MVTGEGATFQIHGANLADHTPPTTAAAGTSDTTPAPAPPSPAKPPPPAPRPPAQGRPQQLPWGPPARSGRPTPAAPGTLPRRTRCHQPEPHSPVLELHRVGGRRRFDERGLPEALRVEEVDLAVGSQQAAVGPESHQRVVRPARLIRGFHHARHQRDAVAAGNGGELLADGAVQRLGHLGERRVHLLFLVGGVLREGDQRGAVVRCLGGEPVDRGEVGPDVGTRIQLPQRNPHNHSSLGTAATLQTASVRRQPRPLPSPWPSSPAARP